MVSGPREAPDAREFLARSVTQSPYRFVAKVRYTAPAERVAGRIPASAGVVEALDEGSCVLTAAAERHEQLVLHLAMVGVDFTVLEPPELRAVVTGLSERLRRAGSGA